jgi:hypothetical protein
VQPIKLAAAAAVAAALLAAPGGAVKHKLTVTT